MDRPALSQDAGASNAGQRARRPSFRKSLNECSLPSGYLDALETKRRTLDESIHKFIASKEREYKQYEKELKHQARRAEHYSHEHQASTQAPERGNETAEALFRKAGGHQHEEGRKQEDFTGVFTPEYLTALRHDAIERSSSEPSVATVAHSHTPISPQRSASDVAVHDDPTSSTRLLLSRRISSPGSSIDGRLISAMKSTTSPDMSQPKRKRVSLAVGDTIVAPSDNVPSALRVNSISSHSRPSTPRRERAALIDDVASLHETNLTSKQHYDQRQGESLDVLRQQGSASAALLATEAADPARSGIQQERDVGDLFDLEESDEDEISPKGGLETDPAAEYFGESQKTAILGRVGPSHPASRGSLTDAGVLNGPSDSITDEADDMQDVPLTPVTGVAASQQPVDPGFRRPSVLADPIHHRSSSHTLAAEEAADLDAVYSSSYSRPTSKGSFTSGSLGESYMARNAEAMIELRAQQRQASQHRSSQPTTALPVR